MLQGHSSVLQALLGTFFTWGLTAAGAALVFVFSSGQVSRLASGLRFWGGVCASWKTTTMGGWRPPSCPWPCPPAQEVFVLWPGFSSSPY